MSFAFPAFLYALGLLSIPIVIHLFNFRRFQTIRFSNVHLLEQVQEETKSTARLKHWLLLLARLLFLACLIVCFAGPFIPPSAGDGSTKDDIVLFIDNSPSMQAASEQSSLFDAARQKALAVLSALPDNATVRVYTSDAAPGENRELTKKEAKEKIEFLTIGYKNKSLAAVAEKVKNNVGENAQLFVFSDFQKTTLKDIEPTIKQNWIPSLAATNDNLSIDTAYFSSPTHLADKVETLVAVVHNHSAEEIDNVSIDLEIDGNTVSVVNATLTGEEKKEITFTYTNKQKGVIHGKLKLSDNPVTFDNQYFFSYRVADKVNVIELKQTNDKTAIQRLFEGSDEYWFQSFTNQNVDYGVIQQSGCLIINGLSEIPSGLVKIVKEKIAAGNSVLFIPNTESGNTDSYNQLLTALEIGQFTTLDTSKMAITKVENTHPFFSKIFDRIPAKMDLPSTLNHYQLALNGTAQSLYTYGNGASFLAKSPQTIGHFYVLSASLALTSSNWSNHALFVPTTLRIAEMSGYKQDIATTINATQPITLASLGNETGQLTMQEMATTNNYLPTFRKQANGAAVFIEQLPLAIGNYTFSMGTTTIGGIGVNHTNNESNLAHYTLRELNELANANTDIHIFEGNTIQLGQSIQESFTGKKLWYLFACLSVLFLIAETILSRWIK